MSSLTTDFSSAPYYDDYDASKQYYRILFVPKKAVQTREINQLQTYIQEQISRFGNHVFKDGSVVNGCSISYNPGLQYIRLENAYNDISGNTAMSTDALSNMLVVSANTGVRAAIQLAKPGYKSTYPDTNRFYVKYLTPGYDNANNQVSYFKDSDTLIVYSPTQEKFGVLDANNIYNTINVYTPNLAANQQSGGIAYGITVGDGVIYQKGYFVNVLSHTITVKDFDTDTDDMLVGFDTKESIVSYLQDGTLIDPADTSQRNGIGADRLKLVPTLVAYSRSELTDKEDFFPIVEFSRDNPAQQNIDPEYAALGDVIAQGIYEPHGDFYIKPFITGSVPAANTSNFIYTIGTGTSYVKGDRVEILATKYLEAPRATTTSENTSAAFTLNYGNYIVVNELVGVFDYSQMSSIDLYDTAQQSITTNSGSTSAPTGTKIGTANVTGVVYNAGTKGANTASYRVYLTNINMNSTKNFSSVKSIHVPSGTKGKAKADLVLESNTAVIKDSSKSQLIFNTGIVGLRRLRNAIGGNDNQYSFRTITSGTLQSNGSVTFTLASPHAGGTERFFSSVGTVSNVNELKIDLVTSAALSANSGNLIAGTVLDLSSNATVTVVSNTQFTVDLNTTFTGGAPQTIYASYPVVRSQAVEKKKTANKGIFVKIDCSTGGTSGVWNLGLTDAYALEAVYVGTTYSENNPDRKSWFALDNGQRDTYYEHSRLIMSSNKDKVNASTKILVKLSHFTSSDLTGIGFYSVDSYPTRGPLDSANTTNISFAEIPTYGDFDLRNSVDFRLSKQNTANSTTVIASATVNPAASNNTFLVSGSGTYLGEPDSNFGADIEYYLPRYDLIQVDRNGRFYVKSSVPDLYPTVPAADNDATPVATVYVPPFPSLTQEETIKGKDFIAPKLVGNRVYTMKDIYGLDQRITRLEYYQTLSMLEMQARDVTIRDENGLDRFKNGIFADPFNNHLLGDVSNFEYTIAIDEGNSLARSRFIKEDIDYKVASTNNATADGRLGRLNSTPDLFITQPYASKYRNATEAVWSWSGRVGLFPGYDHYKNEESSPAVNVTLDLASPWQDFANSPFGMNYGDWRTVSSSSSSATIGTSSSSSSSTSGRTTTTNTTTVSTVQTTTSTVLQQTIEKLSVGTSTSKIDLGTYVDDITLNPYMRSREVAFIATGLKPNARFWVFFDKVDVSSFCAPGTISNLYDITTGIATTAAGKESEVVKRTAAPGTQLVSDANGTLAGIFIIPADKFRVGDREFIVANIDSLVTGEDAITSSARAVYTASSMTLTTTNASINVIQPELNVSTSLNTRVEQSTNVTQKVSTSTATTTAPNDFGGTTLPSRSGFQRGSDGGPHGDPLGQSFVPTPPEDVTGIFLDSIGVYFKTKDPNLGITCCLCEVTAGVPDTSKIIATAYNASSGVSISNNASAETKFIFDKTPYLTSNKYYAFFLMPDGNSPEYLVWMSEVGGEDIISGVKIFSNPYIGVAYTSSNSNSWTALQTEDIKFNIYRCQFSPLTGTIELWDEDDDYFTVDGFTYPNANSVIQVGDVVYTQNSSGSLILGNTAPTGYVQYIDTINDRIALDRSTGGFTANTIIEIHRPSDLSNVATISANTKIATATIESVDDIDYSIIVPRIAMITPVGTNVQLAYKGTDISDQQDNSWKTILPEIETEYFDKMRAIKSKSNRGSLDWTGAFQLTLTSVNDYITPVIDLTRRSMFAIKNDINNDLTDEETRYGAAKTKYLCKPVILAEGQDAEDIRVYVTGYRPADTDITCYIKVLNSADTENFVDKQWTKMDMTEGNSVYSSTADVTDYREYVYQVPTAEAAQGQAYLNQSNSGIIQYRNSSGAVYVGYKIFAIKLVLTAASPEVAPRMRDVRSIALQI